MSAAPIQWSEKRLGVWRRVKWGLIGLVALSLVVVLIYAEENWRGKRAWEECRRRLAVRGVELNWRGMAPPAVPDEENFAATPFLAALFDYLPGTYTPRDLQAYNRTAGFAQTDEPYSEDRGGRDPMPPMTQRKRTDLAQALALVRKAKSRQPGGRRGQAEEIRGERREVAAALLDAVEEYRSVLDELRAASRRPQARFNISYAEDYSWRVSEPHLPVLKRVSRVLTWRASAELAMQNSAAAAEDVGLMISLAGALRDEPFQNSFAARNIILYNARQIIWEGLADHAWSDERLREFQARLQPFTVLDVQRYLRLERIAGNSVFEWVHKEPKLVNGWQFGSTLSDKFRGYVLRHMPTGWMYLEQVSYERVFQESAMPALDVEAGCVRPRMIEQACHPAHPLWGHQMLVGPVMQGTRYLLLTAALAQAGASQAVIACALERHRLATGQLPENLEAAAAEFPGAIPADVITGKPMKYRRSEEGQFLLYSIGWNEQDDGGRVVTDKGSQGPDATQGDWVWPAYPTE